MKSKIQPTFSIIQYLLLTSALLLYQVNASANTSKSKTPATGIYQINTPEKRIHTVVTTKIRPDQEKLYLELTEQLVAGIKKTCSVHNVFPSVLTSTSLAEILDKC